MTDTKKTNTGPPKGLSEATSKLWRKLETDYRFDDAGRTLLQVACEAPDRIKEARAIIATDGLIVGEGPSARRHPACDLEKQYYSVYLRAWRDLGFDKADAPLGGSHG